jgi:glycerate kinase
MRVVIAPDKFAGTLTAAEAASAIANGWRSAMPADDLVLTPMSDGGHGFLDTIASVFAGRRETNVDDALGRPVGASWLFTTVAGTPIAVIESAQACGISRLTPEELNPLTATSYGVGQLIGGALASGARRILVGLGGTATNDGGAGMAQALGVRLLDADGNDLPRGAGALERLDRVDVSGLDKRLANVDVVAVVDVDNVLLGADGATRSFAGQKGADEPTSARLEAALARYAGLVTEATGAKGTADRPGAGAAGGLGFALAAFAGAAIHQGVELVSDILGVRAKMAHADLVITGEGRFDQQSLRGKVPTGIAALAGEAGLPCLVLAGDVTVGRQEMRAAGITGAYSVTDLVGSQGEALAKPAHWLEKLAAQAAREWSRPAGEPGGRAAAEPPAGPPPGQQAVEPAEQSTGSGTAPPTGMRS